MSTEEQQEQIEILKRYDDLIHHTYRKLNEDQLKLIKKAFDVAWDAHKDQRRKSGEPYIFHPIAVAKIVAEEIGLGATSIAAALLHDVIEDSDYTYEDIEKNDFNLNIPRYIDTSEEEEEIDIRELSANLRNIDREIKESNEALMKMFGELTFSDEDIKGAVEEFIKVFGEV